MRRTFLILASLIGATLAFPLTASADQAILAHDATFEIAPGEVVDHADVLIMSRSGMPTVDFDGSTGFSAGETVVATITLSTQAINGLGSVELLSSPTISGTTSADWPNDESPEFAFEPAIELRYTAPSAADLGCEDRPGERVTTHLGVSATLIGSAGTMASFSAEDFPGVVSFVITCPASPARSGAPNVTTPPTDAVPLSTGASPRADQPTVPVFLLASAGVGGLVFLSLQSSRRSHRR
jgi:hypothetical protein